MGASGRNFSELSESLGQSSSSRRERVSSMRLSAFASAAATISGEVLMVGASRNAC
jgi:hypothetical protein